MSKRGSATTANQGLAPTNQMTNNKSRRNNGRRNANNGSVARGLAVARLPTQRASVALSVTGTLASDAACKLAGAFAMNPSSADKWSQYASIYDQFRVVGGRLSLASIAPNSSTVLNSIAIFAFDNDSTGTPTAYSDVTAYSEMRRMPVCWTSGSIKQVNFARPRVNGEMQQVNTMWLDEQTPSGSLGALKFYADGLTASTNYWHYILEYLVEFIMRS